MLTTRQKEVLDYINEFLGLNGIGPSLREVCRHFGISVGTLQGHIEALKRKGYLEKGRLRHRGVTPVNRSPGISIPLLGEVRAGHPIFAEENVEFFISVDRGFAGGGRLFSLRIDGDSMIEAGMFEGDIVVVRQQYVAQNGDIVVALREDEATVKYYRERRSGVFLEPANSRFRSMPIKGFSVIGKVVGLIRKY